MSRDFLLFGFFLESVSPQPQSIQLGRFQSFSKIHGDIRKSRCNTGINDTNGKFAAGVVDTGLPRVSLVLLIPVANLPPVSTIFAVGVNDTSGNLPPVSTTPAATNGYNIRLLRP